MIPLPRYAKQCDQQYVVGCEYPLQIVEARSRASHSHFFAAISTIWDNLPDDVAKRFPSSEHMRKWALCKAGYCTERSFIFDDVKKAREVATFIRSVDTYGVITVSENIVKVYEAMSQSAAAMGKEEFQKSKDEVLRILAEMIGTPVAQVRREASRTFRPEPTRKAVTHGR